MTSHYETIRSALEAALKSDKMLSGKLETAKYAKAFAALAELERAAVEPVAVTQEMCERVAASFYGVATFANGVEMNEALQLWQRELGPTLGMVAMREPTPEERARIWNEYAVRVKLTSNAEQSGRVMAEAVRAVMGGES